MSVFTRTQWTPTDLAKELLQYKDAGSENHKALMERAAQALLDAETEIETPKEHWLSQIPDGLSVIQTKALDKLRERTSDLEAKLKLCVEALEFYGQARHFYEKDSEVIYFTIEDSKELEDHLPGKRARETLAKVKGKSE